MDHPGFEGRVEDPPGVAQQHGRAPRRHLARGRQTEDEGARGVAARRCARRGVSPSGGCGAAVRRVPEEDRPRDPRHQAQSSLGIVVAARSAPEVLASAKTIAVVGASRDPRKPGGSVPEGLQRRGFRIIPINPFADELFGERVYRSLADVPEKVDIVDVFRPADDARQAVAIGAKALWLQQDIRSEEARRIAQTGGLDYVEDECTAVVASLYQIKKDPAA